MIATIRCRGVPRCARRGGARSSLAGCGDKEIDPPAELVDIVATRDGASCVDARASAATPSGCASRLRPIVVDGTSCTRLRTTARSWRLAADSGRRAVDRQDQAGAVRRAGSGRRSGRARLQRRRRHRARRQQWHGALAQGDRQRSARAPARRQRRRRHPHGRRSRRRAVDRRRRTALGRRRAGAAAHAARHCTAGAGRRSHHRRVRQRQGARDRSAQWRCVVGRDRERTARPHRAGAPRGHRLTGARRPATTSSSSASRGASRCSRLDSGQIWWARDASSYRGFTMDDEHLYLTNADSVVIAMSRSDGSVLWEQDAMKRRGLTAPALDGDALVVGDFEGYVHWLDKATGEIVARQKTDGERITQCRGLDRRGRVRADGFRQAARVQERGEEAGAGARQPRGRRAARAGARAGADPSSPRPSPSPTRNRMALRCCRSSRSSDGRMSASRRCSISSRARATRWLRTCPG